MSELFGLNEATLPKMPYSCPTHGLIKWLVHAHWTKRSVLTDYDAGIRTAEEISQYRPAASCIIEADAEKKEYLSMHLVLLFMSDFPSVGTTPSVEFYEYFWVSNIPSMCI